MEKVNFTYNKYREGDYDDFMEMAFCLYDEDPGGLPITEGNILRTANECVNHPEKVQILMISDGVENIGYGIVAFMWSNEYGGDVVIVDELFVKAGHRGRHAASGLFRHVFEAYSDAVMFELETTPSNQRALKLYRSFGFEASANTHMLRRPTRCV